MDPNETLRIIQESLDTARKTNDIVTFLNSMQIVQEYAEYAIHWVRSDGFLPKTYREANSEKTDN